MGIFRDFSEFRAAVGTASIAEVEDAPPDGGQLSHGGRNRRRPADRLRGRADRSFITAEVCKQALLKGYLTSHQGAQVTGGA